MLAGRSRALARLGVVVVLIALAAGQVRFWPEADRGLTARREVARVGAFGPDDRVLNLMPLINVLVGRSHALPGARTY